MSRSEVHVYWKNRTAKVWSLRQGGLVIDRRPSLTLRDCRFHAGESLVAFEPDGTCWATLS